MNVCVCATQCIYCLKKISAIPYIDFDLTGQQLELQLLSSESCQQNQFAKH